VTGLGLDAGGTPAATPGSATRPSASPAARRAGTAPGMWARLGGPTRAGGARVGQAFTRLWAA